MKIDRLIGILSVLLQKDKVTAPYLAERFEVSKRTISRDIEDLCRAGIPIVTRQGVNGGISVMDNYKIDRTLLTTTEMQEILAGLRGLDSISGTNQYGQLMEKLSAGASDFMTANQSVLIDLSLWDKGSLAPKIEMIRTGIEHNHFISFDYFSPSGESKRKIEPYYLIFRWSSWYVWGWCTKRQEFRLFKLNRMDHLCISENTYEKRKVQMPDLETEKLFPGGIKIEAVFCQECKWRLIEEYGPACFTERPDRKLLFHREYTNKNHLMNWLLSFGDQVELKNPGDIRMELKEIIENMRRCYESDN
ncbi:MAG TPA: YafY family protein [Lachnospiraceae bacterium]|nr:YafY family protein [Lachnospiraceae bacterium]